MQQPGALPPRSDLRGPPVARLRLIIQMSHPGNERVVALFLRPLDCFLLCLERCLHVVGMVLYDIILDRTSLRTPLWPRFNVNVGHLSLLDVSLANQKFGANGPTSL